MRCFFSARVARISCGSFSPLKSIMAYFGELQLCGIHQEFAIDESLSCRNRTSIALDYLVVTLNEVHFFFTDVQWSEIGLLRPQTLHKLFIGFCSELAVPKYLHSILFYTT